MNVEQPALDPRLQIETDRAEVPNDLIAGFLEGEEERRLPTAAGGVDEVSRDTGLARAGAARYQHAALAEIALAAQHLIEPRDARRYAAGRDAMLKTERRDRQHGNAGLVDEERRLIGVMGRAAVLHDAQASRRVLLDDAVVEENDAVGDVLLEPLARETSAAAFAGYDRRHGLGSHRV